MCEAPIARYKDTALAKELTPANLQTCPLGVQSLWVCEIPPLGGSVWAPPHNHGILEWNLSQMSCHILGSLGLCSWQLHCFLVFQGLDASSPLLGQRAENQQNAEQVSFPLCISSLCPEFRYNHSGPNNGNGKERSLRRAWPYLSNWFFKSLFSEPHAIV